MMDLKLSGLALNKSVPEITGKISNQQSCGESKCKTAYHVTEEVLADKYAADTYKYGPDKYANAVSVMLAAFVHSEAHQRAGCKAHRIGGVGGKESVQVACAGPFQDVETTTDHLAVQAGP